MDLFEIQLPTSVCGVLAMLNNTSPQESDCSFMEAVVRWRSFPCDPAQYPSNEYVCSSGFEGSFVAVQGAGTLWYGTPVLSRQFRAGEPLFIGVRTGESYQSDCNYNLTLILATCFNDSARAVVEDTSIDCDDQLTQITDNGQKTSVQGKGEEVLWYLLYLPSNVGTLSVTYSGSTKIKGNKEIILWGNPNHGTNVDSICSQGQPSNSSTKETEYFILTCIAPPAGPFVVGLQTRSKKEPFEGQLTFNWTVCDQQYPDSTSGLCEWDELVLAPTESFKNFNIAPGEWSYLKRKIFLSESAPSLNITVTSTGSSCLEVLWNEDGFWSMLSKPSLVLLPETTSQNLLFIIGIQNCDYNNTAIVSVTQEYLQQTIRIV